MPFHDAFERQLPSNALDEARHAARTTGVIIVGAGQAGGRAAESLRRSGFLGSVMLIGDEAERPYERPSLSKEMLLDLSQESVAWLHPPAFYNEQEIELRCSERVVAIDRKNHCVRLSTGESVRYGVTILATGGHPRRLPLVGYPEQSIFTLRSLADSRRLRTEMREGRNLVIVGAGFIGLEVAAAAVRHRCHVTVVEAGPHPLGRVAPREIGVFYEQLHRQHGVSFRLNTQIVGAGKENNQHFIQTNAGEAIPCDVLVVGIGIIPNDSLAADAGLAVDRGIIVDQYGASNDPRVFAVGDVARQFTPRFGRHLLLESWQNAQNQAIAVGQNLAAESTPEAYDAIPWFWSDQYGVNLQMYGVTDPGGENIVRGRLEDQSWIMFQTLGGKISAIIGANASRPMRAMRNLIGREFSKTDLADSSVPLAELARRGSHRAEPLV